ncbi:SbcC/MukB-like Walker B domain-containing protein [Phocaeicola barnesiae]|nr:SbcC/MukB-like Walker B domain-containing protein [Phocaeicola barnesiae]MDM8250918.1 SbcC/MukB-like Walker B domain-containing protein [Phocaeicola barnesiae]
MACQAGSLTILLRDYYQGGSARPTSTLSGGESFLVSLSLALGLSSLNQHRLSTDMLFIDEGFGTLSEDYLNTVMDTLERLHQLGGKKVGIISHVEGFANASRPRFR